MPDEQTEIIEEEPKEEPTEAAEPTEPAEELAEEEPVEEAAPVEEPPPPKKKTAQERIDEITKKRREAEREAEYWRRVALEKANKEKETPQQQEPDIPKRPKLEQFETAEAYEDALFEWRDTKRAIETRVEREREESTKALAEFNRRANALRDEHEDFDEVIERPVFTPMMRNVLLKSENGPEIAYYLGSPDNQEVAEKIMSLPVEMQIYELGRLETNLLLAKKTKKVTAAPAPIKPVGMSGTATVDPSKMSDEEWFKWDQEQRRGKIKQKFGG